MFQRLYKVIRTLGRRRMNVVCALGEVFKMFRILFLKSIDIQLF